MNTLLVGYDLHRPGQDYEDLIEYLKTMPNWWHYLDSTWIIQANFSAGELRDKLRTFTDDNDSLLVIVLPKGVDWASFLPEAGNDWLRQVL